MSEPTTSTRQLKITLGEMRASGVRSLLVYCADYRCARAVRICGDWWPDHIRLSDLEPLFVCQACGRRGQISGPIGIGTLGQASSAPLSADFGNGITHLRLNPGSVEWCATMNNPDQDMLMMTTPGVGPVVALTYRATVDVPARFPNSKAVGAVFGLTPSKYQSARSTEPARYQNAGTR